jgi:hypothetical protein
MSETTDCLIWPKGKTGKGYGEVYLCGVAMPAHRLVYWIYFGPIPKGMWVLHKCDNPPCVNPNHLFLGTPKDNSVDAWTKGRLVPPPTGPGELNPRARLSASQVLEIRRRYSAGGVLQEELAKEFGVTPITISKITTRTNWRHL